MCKSVLDEVLLCHEQSPTACKRMAPPAPHPMVLAVQSTGGEESPSSCVSYTLNNIGTVNRWHRCFITSRKLVF